MGISVRIAVQEDLGTLVQLMEEFYAESQYQLDRHWAEGAFGVLIGQPELGCVFLLLDDLVPAGYAVLTLHFSMESGGLDAFVDDLFVRPQHRRRGLGDAAMRAFFYECQRRGVLAAHVVVGANNRPAQALYARYGFVAPKDDRQTLSVEVDDTKMIAP
jgi:ribosomal protein S18 acetylase RimI-like enzyme